MFSFYDKNLIIHPLHYGQMQSAMEWWWAGPAPIYRGGTVILWAGPQSPERHENISMTNSIASRRTNKQPNTKHICVILHCVQGSRLNTTEWGQQRWVKMHDTRKYAQRNICNFAGNKQPHQNHCIKAQTSRAESHRAKLHPPYLQRWTADLINVNTVYSPIDDNKAGDTFFP